MSHLKGSQVINIHDCKGNNPSEILKDAITKVGQYIVAHAEDLSADVRKEFMEMELKVKIDNQSIFVLEKNIKNYILED